MGTVWSVSVWDGMDDATWKELQQTMQRMLTEFEDTYSRFKETSIIRILSTQTGLVGVPADLVKMLRLYEQMHALSDGAFTPLLGHTLSDLGYDETYSLTPKKEIRKTPRMAEAITIIDDTHTSICTQKFF